METKRYESENQFEYAHGTTTFKGNKLKPKTTQKKKLLNNILIDPMTQYIDKTNNEK